MRISDWSSDVCSSDLLGVQFLHPGWLIALALPRRNLRVVNIIIATVRTAAWGIDHRRQKRSSQPRSEEQTSELQSLMRISYAVFCLIKQHVTHITTFHV